MNEFFENLKTVNWKRIGHWTIYPVLILVSRFIGSFIGIFIYKLFTTGMLRAEILGFSEGSIDKALQAIFMSTASITSGLFATVNFIPNQKYKYNALYFVAGTSLGVELRNFATLVIEKNAVEPLFFIDIIITSLMLLLAINWVYQDHKQFD